MSSAETLIGGADQATAVGDLRTAEQLLKDAAIEAPGDLTIHLKLAAIQRATGQLSDALGSVNRALAINPLDFTASAARDAA